MKTKTRLLQIYFSLMLGTTLLLLIRLLDRGGGFSLSRVVLLIPVMILTVGSAWLACKSWHDPQWLDRLGARLDSILERENFYGSAALLGTGLIFLGAWGYQIGRVIHDPYFQGYFSKIAPFLLWLIIIAALTLLLARFFRFGGALRVFQTQYWVFKASALAFAGLLILTILMALTGLGLKPDLISWGDPGTPVLPGQVLLLAALALAALVLRETLIVRGFAQLTPRAQTIMDILIFGLIWLLTIVLWQAQPLTPAYFAPQPVAPNFEYYPYSDAANYEVSAQELLIGLGFGTDVRRPLYSLFLALAQLASGVGYAQILLWQIPLLALIPPFLFLLGKALHSRLTGGLIAGLALFHEVNAIRLSSIVNVSHAKLLMSDLPTALGVIAFSVVLIYWWQAPQCHRAYPLLAGGILALTMLVRIQVVVLLPGVLLPMLITFWGRKRQFAAASLLMLLGMACALLPWMWRGQQASGSLSFAEAAQESQIGLIGVRYNLNPEAALGAPLPGETSNQYSQRMFASAVDFIATHPVNALKFITAHFLHNLVSTLLTLPPTYASAVPVTYLEITAARTWEQCCSVQSYVRHLPYWGEWDGRLPGEALFPLIFNLLALAVGLGAAWKHNRGLGLLPLWISLIYALGNALVRSSGWRFNLPVDWVGLFYYGLGLVQIITWGAMFFANRLLPDETQPKLTPTAQISFPWGQTLVLGGLLFLVSAAIPISEALIPARYPAGWLAQTLDDPLLQAQLNQAGISEALPDFAAQTGSELIYGRALYPRFYSAGQGIPGQAWFAFVPREYTRLGFYLVGPHSQNVVLPLGDAPANFPHAADVIVLGCLRDEYLEAQLVILRGETDTVLFDSSQFDWGCK